ncbi:MAG: Fic family protein [Candidatus Hadarchaeota archaeon]
MILVVSIHRKKIKGHSYPYLVKSVRLPNGKIVTINKMLDKKEKVMSPEALERIYRNYFVEKEKELYKKFAESNLKKSYIFASGEIAKLEEIRVSYKHLINRLSKNQLKDIFDRFTVNFTYNSNAIEGNSLTLKDVAIVMFENGIVKSRDLREIYETRNSRKVVDSILHRKYKITHEDTIKMHKMLMRDIDERTGYKQLPNVLLSFDREIQTTRPEDVKKEMGNLIKWYEKNSAKMHPLELATIFHGRFEKIHPFEDGNGRVGRFLINVILVNNGYPPLIVRKTVRESYISALQAFDGGYQDKLKRFMLEKFKDTYAKFFEVYVKYM